MCESQTAILLCVILRGSKNKADGLPKKGTTYYSPIISRLTCMQQSIQGVETVHYDRFTRFQAQLQLNQGNFARRNEFENTFSTRVVQKLRGLEVVGRWPKNVCFCPYLGQKYVHVEVGIKKDIVMSTQLLNDSQGQETIHLKKESRKFFRKEHRKCFCLNV